MSQQKEVYIGCLPAIASEEGLLALLSQFAQIERITLTTKKGKCIGSGRATVSDVGQQKALLEAQIFYGERRLELAPFLENNNLKKLQQDINLRKIAVRSLFVETSNEELHDAFSCFGEIENAFMSSDKKEDTVKGPKNYGFVTYKSKLSAFKAIMGYVMIRGVVTDTRLARVKDVGETFFMVRGKKILAKDLEPIQFGKLPKLPISDLMDEAYNQEALKIKEIISQRKPVRPTKKSKKKNG